MKALLLLALTTLPLAAQAAETITFQTKAVVRFFGTKEFCEESQGEYEPNEDDAERGACYITQNDGNKIQITGKTLHIETLFGAAHERSFDGKIVHISAGKIVALEAELRDNGQPGKILKGGCKMTIAIRGDLASTELGANCDSGLNLFNVPRVQ